jgi:hypothetical protein
MFSRSEIDVVLGETVVLISSSLSQFVVKRGSRGRPELASAETPARVASRGRAGGRDGLAARSDA